jgi:hypothetical protein
MWLGLFVFIFLVVGIAGSIFSGGIFTIVILPLGVICLLAAVVWGGLGRAAQDNMGKTSRQRRDVGEPPLPHTAPSSDPANHQPATPDDLVRARQRQ